MWFNIKQLGPLTKKPNGPWYQMTRIRIQTSIFFVKESRSFGSNNEKHWGLRSTVDSNLVSHPAVPGSIRGVPKFFQRNSMLPGFIDCALLRESGECKG